jgi:hypothetical protein
LHDPWCHHMGNHSVYEMCRLEGLGIVIRHGSKPPAIRACTIREGSASGDVSQV